MPLRDNAFMSLPQNAPPAQPAADRYAVIGHPISHSKSPLIHAAFAQATGQHLEYGAIDGGAEPGGFQAAVDAFRAAGGRGMNVTVPFKLEAFAYAGQLSARAQAAGAVNALKFEGSQCHGENFDGVGLVRDIEHNLGLPLRGRRVLLLGAGGASRGALFPLLEAGPAQLLVANRTASKAQALVQEFVARGASAAVLQGGGFDALQALTTPGFDVVINATSASLGTELPPLPPAVFAPGSLAYEMMYGKGLTPFLHVAQQAGAARLADGVGMLVEQAAESFLWWRGVRPQTAAVIELIRTPLV
jgi:shikimate dehydrogenase